MFCLLGGGDGICEVMAVFVRRWQSRDSVGGLHGGAVAVSTIYSVYMAQDCRVCFALGSVGQLGCDGREGRHIACGVRPTDRSRYLMEE